MLFLQTGVMVNELRQVETADCRSERLKVVVNTH